MFQIRRRITARVLPGLLIAGLGVLLVLNNLDVYPLWGLERYWPLLLVAFGIHRVLDPARRGRGLGVAVLVAGIWLQLSKLDLLSFHLADLKLYWPLILVAIGFHRLTPPARLGCVVRPRGAFCGNWAATRQFRDCPLRRVAHVAVVADRLGDRDGLQRDAREGLAALARIYPADGRSTR